MRQDLFRICSARLRSRKAESLAELLVSVLVIVLALTMFASALMAARKMLANGNQIIGKYYAARNALELEGSTDAGSADADSTDTNSTDTDQADTDSTARKTDADLVFRVEDGTNYKVTGFSHRTGAANVGEYPVTLYSSQETDDAADGAQEAAGYYRYSRKQ